MSAPTIDTAAVNRAQLAVIGIGLLKRQSKKQNIDEPALFLSLKGSRISVRSVERIVKKYSDAAITTKKITPHKLRSTYGTNLYGETGDALVVKDALGHSNISVVQKYVKADENARKEASKMADTWLNDI